MCSISFFFEFGYIVLNKVRYDNKHILCINIIISYGIDHILLYNIYNLNSYFNI